MIGSAPAPARRRAARVDEKPYFQRHAVPSINETMAKSGRTSSTGSWLRTISRYRSPSVLFYRLVRILRMGYSVFHGVPAMTYDGVVGLLMPQQFRVVSRREALLATHTR